MEVQHARSRGGRGRGRGVGSIFGGGAMQTFMSGASAGAGGQLATAAMAGSTVATVSMSQIEQIGHVARTNPIVRAVLEKVLTDTVDCRFSIRLRYGDDTIELRESERRAIDTMWPIFVRELLWSLQVFGLAVVAADRGTKMPRVVPLDYIRVQFHESARDRRTYWVEERHSNRRLDVLVVVKYPPLRSGALTSPAASVVSHAARYERVMANQDDADYHATHPVWAFATDKNGAGRPDPKEHDEIVEGEVRERYTNWQAEVAEQEQTAYERSVAAAMAGHESMLAQGAAAAPLPVGAQRPPWLNNFFLPLNQSVTAGPMPKANPNFSAELELLESKILQAFRVPPMVMETSHAVRFSTQPDLAIQQWGATVRSLQRELAVMISEVYMFASADVFAAYAKAIVGQVANEKVVAIEQLTKRRRRGGDDTDAGGDGGDDGGDDDSAEPVPGPEKNDQGKLQMPETDESLRRAAKILSVPDELIVSHIFAQLSVDAEFHTRPTLKTEELRALFAEGLLSRDAYATRMAEMVGLPAETFLIGEKEQLEDARARKKRQDILEPPEQKKPAGGGAAKKRPAGGE